VEAHGRRKEGTVRYLTPKLAGEFDKAVPLAKGLALLADAYSYARFQRGLTVTSIFRMGEGEKIHHTGRAIDLDDDIVLGPEEKQEIADVINDLFAYDPERPEMKVAIYHTVEGRGGDHLHLQVHPRTAKRTKEA
jgi:hypothetical protein